MAMIAEHAEQGCPETNGREAPTLKELVADFERRLILNALTGSLWHQRRAAASLGILPTTLVEKMKRLGIPSARRQSCREASVICGSDRTASAVAEEVRSCRQGE